MAKVLGAFSAAVDRHDVDAIMAVMTDDCVFENSGPAPDGQRAEDQAAVRAVWDGCSTRPRPGSSRARK
jgi:ketosteroid isomerase-like protein